MDLQLDLGRPSKVKPTPADSMRNLWKRPKPCGWGDCRAVYFGTEARMDSFAAVPTMS